MRAKEQDDAARRAWWQHVQTLDAGQMVFLDECGVNTTMHRRFAQTLWPFSQRNTLPRRCAAQLVVPRNWKTSTTILGALSLQGVQAVFRR